VSITVHITATREEWQRDPGAVKDRATAAVQREYRRQNPTARKRNFIWGWNTESWQEDGSSVTLHGTLCWDPGKQRGRPGYPTGYPVLAECWAYVREVAS
jgi:hypothetical protein